MTSKSSCPSPHIPGPGGSSPGKGWQGPQGPPCSSCPPILPFHPLLVTLSAASYTQGFPGSHGLLASFWLVKNLHRICLEYPHGRSVYGKIEPDVAHMSQGGRRPRKRRIQETKCSPWVGTQRQAHTLQSSLGPMETGLPIFFFNIIFPATSKNENYLFRESKSSKGPVAQPHGKATRQAWAHFLPSSLLHLACSSRTPSEPGPVLGLPKEALSRPRLPSLQPQPLQPCALIAGDQHFHLILAAARPA